MKIEKIEKIKKETCAPEVIRVSAEHLPDETQETSVEDLESLIASQGLDIPRPTLITGLKRMADADMGRFIAGRKGHPSRFCWKESPTKTLEILDQTISDKASVEEEALSEVVAHSTGIIDSPKHFTHRFLLRPDFEAEIKLPLDFSEKEAARLGKFISMIPLEC
jgi:hypothetical protein